MQTHARVIAFSKLPHREHNLNFRFVFISSSLYEFEKPETGAIVLIE